MNKDPLKEPRSHALNPSLGEEGNTLFIAGGIRWIKRCSWWGWHAVPVCVCVCCGAAAFVLDDIQTSSVWVHTSLVVFPRWGPLHGEAVSDCNAIKYQGRAWFCFFFNPPPHLPHNGHYTSTLINVFIADLMRTVCGWLVKLFNFINLGWNLLCTRQTGVTYKRWCCCCRQGGFNNNYSVDIIEVKKERMGCIYVLNGCR